MPGTIIPGQVGEEITPSERHIRGGSELPGSSQRKKKTSEIPAVSVIRSIKEQAINNLLTSMALSR